MQPLQKDLPTPSYEGTFLSRPLDVQLQWTLSIDKDEHMTKYVHFNLSIKTCPPPAMNEPLYQQRHMDNYNETTLL